MLGRSAGIALLALLMMVAGPVPFAPGQGADRVTTTAVVRLHVLRSEGGRWLNFLWASGFFIDVAGTALTTSRFVRPVRDQPNTYQMLAIKDGTFYGATLVCAAGVTPRPGPLADDELEKDVAAVKLVASDLPFDTWVYNPPEGQSVVIARKHRGPLPAFQPLAFGPDPRISDRVRMTAYGQLLQLDPIPRPWSAEGQVTRVFTGSGSVPLFAVDLGSARINWISGAVVVNAEGLAVGLSAWSRSGPPAEEVSISASALREPCR